MTLDPETARKIATRFNDWGRSRAERSPGIARLCYQLASFFDSNWSVPYFNRGLLEKHEGNWEPSRELNQRAAELDPQDEAAWWNLGIAATALADWNEARRAWREYGIEVPDGPAEISMSMSNACVRLSTNGEVVWGRRLDPARMEIINVPLPESQHRYGDIVLNDGSPNGTRILKEVEAPVFDELMLWKASDYSTYRVILNIPSTAAQEALGRICQQREIGMENWSTTRVLCAECSRGNPGPHECSDAAIEPHFGFAARTSNELHAALRQWMDQYPEAQVGIIELLLPAESQEQLT
jgi:hypothetical protein